MIKHGTISAYQYRILVIFFVVGSSILFAPSLLAVDAKQDAWIAGVVGMGAGLAVVWIYNALSNRYPDLTIVEMSQAIVGKWLGRLVSLLLVSHFFLLSTLVLRDMGDFLTTQIMPDTPLEALLLFYLPVVIFGVRLGLETIARSAELLFPIFLLLFLFLVVTLSPQIKLENIQPVLENGVKPIVRSAFMIWGFPFLELVCFLMITPAVADKPKAFRSLTWGTVTGGMILILLVLLSLLVLGPNSTIRYSFSSYALARKINIGEFITRIEAIMALLWLITLYFKLVLNFYSTAYGLSQVLQLKDYRVLTIPLALLAFVFSLIEIPNSVYFSNFSMKCYTLYVLPYGLVIPLLLLLLSHLRQKQTPHSTEDRLGSSSPDGDSLMVSVKKK